MTITIPNPAHPGELIEQDILPHFGLTVSAAAERLRITRPNLTRVLKGQAELSAELAAKIEAAFGVDPLLLLNMQAAWNLAQVRQRPTLFENIERLPEPA